MSITVEDGALVELDPLDELVFNVDWDDNIAAGVSVNTSVVRIAAIKPRGQAVTAITRSGLTATVTTAAAHGRATNDWVTIEGAAQAEYNITAQITVLSSTTFTYTIAGAPATPATGTITAASGIGLDNDDILDAAPFNSRVTQMRLLGDGVAHKGKRFEVSTTITTNETPTQRKDRSFFVLIADK